MEAQEKELSERESLDLIATMISKARNSYHETGVGAIMWGVIIAFCSLVRLSEIQFGYQLPFDIYLLTIIAVVPSIIMTAQQKKRQRVKPYDEPYLDYLWLGFGICIFLLILIVNSIYGHLNPMVNDYRELTKGRIDSVDFQFSEFVAPFFLLLYGLPTFVTGAAFKFKPMLWGGIFCWVSSVATIYTPIRIDLLLTASSAIMAWLIPGVMMEQEYRKYKKEQAKLDV